MNKSHPLVSICVITYNHEKYIKEAIKGVLMQKTSFPIELVIGEDCSTDNTRKICQEYKAKYPDIIKLNLPDKNIGMMPNFIRTMEACSGKYIALCEGDDYWTDPLKLQKQVDFLEANKEIIFSTHRIEAFGGRTNYLVGGEVNSITNFCDSLISKSGATLSLIFRVNPALVTFINIVSTLDLKIGDWPLEVILSSIGDGYYFSEIMGRYRVHNNGATKGLSLDVYFTDRSCFLEALAENTKITSLQKRYIRAVLFRIYLSKLIIRMFRAGFFESLTGFINNLYYYIIYSRKINFNEFYRLRYAISYRLKLIYK